MLRISLPKPTYRVTEAYRAGIYTHYVHENSLVQLVRETSVRESDYCPGNVCKAMSN